MCPSMKGRRNGSRLALASLGRDDSKKDTPEDESVHGNSMISIQFGFLPIGYSLSLVSFPVSASIR